MYASQQGHVNVVNMLMDYDADVNLQNKVMQDSKTMVVPRTYCATEAVDAPIRCCDRLLFMLKVIHLSIVVVTFISSWYIHTKSKNFTQLKMLRET